jgi:predicted NUDIX family phosphoesterase
MGKLGRVKTMNPNEKVLVVKKDIIFQNEHWQGLKKDNLSYLLDLIRNNYQFMPRGNVEDDPSWQQIVSYIIFSFENKYFLYRYLEKAGEQRLKNDWILGIGGHINSVDVKEGEDILEIGTMREWNEEVDYRGKFIEKKLVGILNDESRPVEAVHLGLIYHFKGDSPEIFVKEKDKIEGSLIEREKLIEYLKNTNGWAPIVWRDYLSKL